mmetsp:Transcript_13569/g.16451  ORF Transcript_13569/g.16451 Transcript_13569/m.16451 type:complete len:350 (+) Transcript_13569:101-1150(+)
MPTFQNSAGAGKAAKFVDANPLAPMADPFAGMDGDETEYQKKLSENLSKRMQNTMQEMKDRHSSGNNVDDDPDRAPTGPTYKAAAIMRKERMAEARRKAEESERLKSMKEEAMNIFADKNGEFDDDDYNSENDDENQNNGMNDDDSDDEFDDLLNDVPLELEAIREKRLREMRDMHMKVAEQRSLGHGEVRTITQDDFLPECTGKSEYVAVHFFHQEFQRCKIMDHHLKLVAPKHMSCKFLRMDAEKAPFFIQKLQIQTLPTLIVFREGKIVDKLTGFEGFATNPNEPDKWHTGRLQSWLATTGAIKYKVPTEEIKDEMRRLGIRPKGTVWSGTSRGGYRSQVYDSDDE